MKKRDVLQAAIGAVADRGLNYGEPEDNFNRIARYWNAHIRNRYDYDIDLDAESVAIMMALMKLARLDNAPNHMDSWVDLAGYAACGGEIVGATEEAPA